MRAQHRANPTKLPGHGLDRVIIIGTQPQAISACQKSMADDFCNDYLAANPKGQSAKDRGGDVKEVDVPIDEPGQPHDPWPIPDHCGQIGVICGLSCTKCTGFRTVRFAVLIGRLF